MMAVMAGFTVANLYYNQPLLDMICRETGVTQVEANLITVITQIGYALGLLFVVPLADMVSVRRIVELTTYLKQQLDKAGYPAWVNEYSNTVFMRCPSPELAHKYQLAQNEDVRFGGKLAHVVVMQHFTEEAIDAFVAELRTWHVPRR